MAVKRHRTARKLSHERLAAMAGIHRTAVSHIESGLRKPSLFVLIKIAKALGIKTSALLKDAEKDLG